MSNEIPKPIIDMVEKLREQGVDVNLVQVASGEIKTTDEPSPLHKVMSQALKAMGEHNFDGNRRCKTLNAMQVIGFLVTEGAHLIGTIEHLVQSHEMPEAAEWTVSTLKLLRALDSTVKDAEQATGNAFQFSNESPEASTRMDANISKAEADLDKLKAKAAPVH